MWQTLCSFESMVVDSILFMYVAIQGRSWAISRGFLNESHSQHARGRVRVYMLSLEIMAIRCLAIGPFTLTGEER